MCSSRGLAPSRFSVTIGGRSAIGADAVAVVWLLEPPQLEINTSEQTARFLRRARYVGGVLPSPPVFPPPDDREKAGPLRDPRQARRGRHGGSLPRTRPFARPRRRAQASSGTCP